MDIVLIFNGLGNQMSQYAFYLAKKRYYPNAKYLFISDKYNPQHNDFELDKVFNIKNTKNHFNILHRNIYNLALLKHQNNIRGKIIRIILKYFKVSLIYENLTYDFNNDNLLKKSPGLTYYKGGWHCEKYFKELKNEISEVYQFVNKKNDVRICDLMEQIRGKNSVSIHVRRGDYLNEQEINIFGKVCDSVYYDKAINYIRQKVEDPFFFIFSDDKQWINENFNQSNSMIVDFNEGKDSWKDMLLMSQCKHNINANSTFSWWGAWLNKNPEKIVVVPERFFLLNVTKDIYPDEWIKIPFEE